MEATQRMAVTSFDHLLLPLIEFNDLLSGLLKSEDVLAQMLEQTPEYLPEAREHIEKAYYQNHLAVKALETHQKIWMSWTRDALNDSIQDHGQLPPMERPG